MSDVRIPRGMHSGGACLDEYWEGWTIILDHKKALVSQKFLLTIFETRLVEVL